MGIKRENIMSSAEECGCSETFMDDLKSFIDDVEREFNNIHSALNVEGFEDKLNGISEAIQIADKIGDELY